MATKRSNPSGTDPSVSPHFTHFDQQGAAHMVDVADKPATRRIARAGGHIAMLSSTLAVIEAGNTRKGDVLAVARIAAITATKRTAELIPLCHSLALTSVGVSFRIDRDAPSVHIEVTCEALGPTGVEMEALTGVAVGLLTIYDMCKAVDRGMRIAEVRLLAKSGGRSGNFVADDRAVGNHRPGGPAT